MRYQPTLPVRFSHPIAVGLPRDVRDVVRHAAAERGLTVADYARLALAERLVEDGIPVRPMPILSVDTIDHLVAPQRPAPNQHGR